MNNIQVIKIISKHKHFMRWRYQMGQWRRIPAPVKKGYIRVMAIIKFNGRTLTKHIDVIPDLCNSFLPNKN